MSTGLEILYQSSAVLAINKPALTHCTNNPNSTSPSSIAKLLANSYPELINVSPSGAKDCGLVQRLDFETSGVILAARDQETWHMLHRELKAGTIKKEYLALVCGNPPKEILSTGWIGAAGRQNKKVRFFTKEPRAKFRGQSAQLRAAKLATGDDLGLSLLLVSIFGGRRHQIRAQLSAAGYPLAGDSLYGAPNREWQGPNFLLHAHKIHFLDPASNNVCTVIAPVPNYFPNFQGVDYKIL